MAKLDAIHQSVSDGSFQASLKKKQDMKYRSIMGLTKLVSISPKKKSRNLTSPKGEMRLYQNDKINWNRKPLQKKSKGLKIKAGNAIIIANEK